jgi:hypothetical protein
MPSRPPSPFHSTTEIIKAASRAVARRRADADPSAVPTKYFAGIPRRGRMELHVRCLPLARPARTAAQHKHRQGRGAESAGSRDAHARARQLWRPGPAKTLEAGHPSTGHGSTTSSPRLERRSEVRTSWGLGRPETGKPAGWLGAAAAAEVQSRNRPEHENLHDHRSVLCVTVDGRIKKWRRSRRVSTSWDDAR